jgi:hypothetical protein
MILFPLSGVVVVFSAASLVSAWLTAILREVIAGIPHF